jgi:hypothetical protein
MVNNKDKFGKTRRYGALPRTCTKENNYKYKYIEIHRGCMDCGILESNVWYGHGRYTLGGMTEFSKCYDCEMKHQGKPIDESARNGLADFF